MRLAELLMRKRFIDLKIRDIRETINKIVKTGDTSQKELMKLKNELFELIDNSKSYKAKIEKSNVQVEINIGESKTTLTDAVLIRDGIIEKMRAIDNVIEHDNGVVDVLSFIEQRDRLFEEYLMMQRSIEVADWSSEID